MENMTKLLKEYNELLDYQKFEKEDLDYSILKVHLGFLESIDVVDNGCLSVFDLYQKKHIYYSPKYESLLGWDPILAQESISYTNSLIHPEDLPQLFRAAIYFISLGFALTDISRKKDYKSIAEYRVMGKDGRYVRIIEQQIPLELDRQGNVWLAMSMVDLSPDHDLTQPFRGRLKNHRTGELFYFPPSAKVPGSYASLTNREREILAMISAGLISKEIADKLYISVNTVNTHRQRIIEKLNVSNTYEAIRYAHERGLFD